MTRARRMVLFWLLLCCGISILWGVFLGRTSPNGMGDFKGIYYDARCLLEHGDPYKAGEPLRVYQAEEGKLPPSADTLRQALALNVYLPTTSVFLAPFAMLQWGTAHVLWMIVTAGFLILAGFLTWEIGADYAPVLAGALICLVLINSEVLFAFGNPAGIAVSLCVVAVWCFLKERLAAAGILCLAVSLAIKPHDAGLVWLYFLLAGGIRRKRALQTLLVTAVLGFSAFVWVWSVAPHWVQEWQSNLSAISAPGSVNDPGLASVTGPLAGMVINLQSAVSVFRNDPRIYNPVSYLVCGALLLVWSMRTFRLRFSQPVAWLALASVVPLTMLVTYHRPYDAKLLLLAVPACAMLWSEGRPMRWIALLVTAAGVLSTGDISAAILLSLAKGFHLSVAGLAGKILEVTLIQPAPIILLAMGIFYLWVYARRDFTCATTDKPEEPGKKPLVLKRA